MSRRRGRGVAVTIDKCITMGIKIKSGRGGEGTTHVTITGALQFVILAMDNTQYDHMNSSLCTGHIVNNASIIVT